MGRKIVATIKEIKGTCGHGHKVGDSFEVSTRNTAGICGWLYHASFPNLTMMSAAQDIWKEGQNEKIVIQGCPDRKNEVLIEYKMVK
jgi:uncharacterized repeat protein (TIGR04076 family)